jgi:hypothetical protein
MATRAKKITPLEAYVISILRTNRVQEESAQKRILQFVAPGRRAMIKGLAKALGNPFDDVWAEYRNEPAPVAPGRLSHPRASSARSASRRTVHYASA